MTVQHRKWHYESDGDLHARTHYVLRYNKTVKGGIERKDFETKAAAMKFLKHHNES